MLGPSSCVLELGCGTSGLVALAAGARVRRYTLTDQAYVSRVLTANLAANGGVSRASASASASPSAPASAPSKSAGRRKGKGGGAAQGEGEPEREGLSNYGIKGNVSFRPLDWELDAPTASLTADPGHRSFDAVVACDCVYNEALIGPLVATCADACALRTGDEGGHAGEGRGPTVCVVAQQLRDSDVFGAWIEAFHARFRTWRLGADVVGQELAEGSGFVVHVGVLRS